MDDWMSSLSRKKHQRRMNKYVRQINRGIQDDDLWDGRFYVRQKRSSWYAYEDHSGGELFVELEFIDRKTGNIMIAAESDNAFCHWHGSKLWEKMNYFIVNWCDVWHETPGPYEQRDLRRKSREED